MKKGFLATTALSVGMAICSPAFAGVNNLIGQGSTRTSGIINGTKGTPVNGNWSMGGGPISYPNNGPSVGLVFHYTDDGTNMFCTFNAPDAVQTTGGNPANLGFFPAECHTVKGDDVAQPAGSGFTFSGSPGNTAGSYSGDAYLMNLRLPDGDTVVTFNGALKVGPN